MPTIRTLSIYVSKDVRISGYFFKPEGILGDASPKYVINISLKPGLCNTDSRVPAVSLLLSLVLQFRSIVASDC